MNQAQRVGGYRLLRVIGEGGMGVVHLGLDPAERAVAVKVVRPHVAADPQTRARLAREVRSLLKVRHPRVAEVLDADFEAELPYVVMRYVPGEALDATVRREGPLRGAALDELAVGLFEAVEAIHSVGVVHRDLKPGNVLLLDGSPVVIDFGIARALDDVSLTSTGLMVGTPGYLSPEVLDGTDVGTAADWWGWGAVVAYAATGRPPFRSGPLEAVWDRVRRGAVDLDGLDEGWARVLAATLRPDPAARPSPRQLADAIAGLTGRRPQAVPPVVGSGAPSGPVGRTPAGAGAATGAVAAASPARSDAVGATRVQSRPAPEAPVTRVVDRPPPPTPVDATRVQPVLDRQAAPVVQPVRRPAAQPVTYPAAPPVSYPATGPAQPAVGPAPAGPVDGGVPPVQPRAGYGPAPVPSLPARPGLSLLAWFVVVAVAAVTPAGGAAVVLVWATLARSVQWSRVAAAKARSRSGRLGAGARTGLVLAYPLRLVGALLSSVGYLVLTTLVVSPLLLIGAALLMRDLPWSDLTVVRSVLTDPPVLSAGVALGALLVWFGLGGRAVREGSRATTEPVTRSANGRWVLIGLAALVVVAAGLVVLAGL